MLSLGSDPLGFTVESDANGITIHFAASGTTVNAVRNAFQLANLRSEGRLNPNFSKASLTVTVDQGGTRAFLQVLAVVFRKATVPGSVTCVQYMRRS